MHLHFLIHQDICFASYAVKLLNPKITLWHITDMPQRSINDSCDWLVESIVINMEKVPHQAEFRCSKRGTCLKSPSVRLGPSKLVGERHLERIILDDSILSTINSAGWVSDSEEFCVDSQITVKRPSLSGQNFVFISYRYCSLILW